MRLLLVVFFLLTSSIIFGATCTTTSTTTWDCGTPGPNDDLIVNHSITITGDFTVNNGSITVNSPNTLTITGNLTFNNNSTVLVNNGGCIHVQGNLLNKNNSGDIEIFGTLDIDGDFTNGTGSGNGAVIDVGSTGTITYGGSCDNPGTVTDDAGFFSGDCDNPILPVELVNFRATATETGNLLQWETASERDNDFFEVHRSGDALNWEVIKKIPGNGTSNQIISYQYLDLNPKQGRNFYRLRQVDYDGAFEFSYIVSVITGQLPQLQIQQTFPNPTTGTFHVSYITNNNVPVFYHLVDELGRTVTSGRINNQFGTNAFVLELSSIPAGIYMLWLENKSLVLSTKLLKLN